MTLNKEQLNFLKSLQNKGNISITGVPESKMSIVYFLESEGHIDVKREIIHSRMDETRTFRHTYGNIQSISLSERGKAYLAGAKNRKWEKLEKWLPIIIATLALLKSYGVTDTLFTLCMKLLEQLQK